MTRMKRIEINGRKAKRVNREKCLKIKKYRN